MNAWGANHGTISYGHIGAELITLASMLRIPVYMHNVDEPRLPSLRLDRVRHRRSRKAPISAPAPTSARSTARPERNRA